MIAYRAFVFVLILIAFIVGLSVAHAATIETVPIGNPGNPSDDTGFGAVAYPYRIGMTEVNNVQYTEFLNAVAATDTFGLYHPNMAAQTWGGIIRNGSPGTYIYTVKADVVGQGPGGSDYSYNHKPVSFVDFYDTLRFANWLHNRQPIGEQNASTTENGAYRFSIDGASAGPRNANAKWFLTSENEWYKAAYYDPTSGNYFDYPTAADTAPNNNLPSGDTGNSANYLAGIGMYTTGNFNYPMTEVGAYVLSNSSYGTLDQAGNVWEWTETPICGITGCTNRVIRGGSWGHPASNLSSSFRVSDGADVIAANYGFRVATVIPEPGTFSLLGLGRLMLTFCACRSRMHAR